MMLLSLLKMRQQTKQYLLMKMLEHHLKMKMVPQAPEIWIKIKVEFWIKMKMKTSKINKMKTLIYLKFCGKSSKLMIGRKEWVLILKNRGNFTTKWFQKSMNWKELCKVIQNGTFLLTSSQNKFWLKPRNQ